MKVAVVGATGRIGRLVCAELDRAGHRTHRLSRESGVDVYTGAGLDAALEGVDAVLDASNTHSDLTAEVVDFFTTATRTLLAAERRADVAHHVLLSVLGVDHGRYVPHYAGKRAQERLVAARGVPWTVVRAAQLFDFPAMLALHAERDGVATVPPLLLQPLAAEDLATVLADVTTRRPLRAMIEVAGPRTEDLVDLARRTLQSRGRELRLVPTWRGSFGLELAGEAMLPNDDALLTATTFEEWLAAGGGVSAGVVPPSATSEGKARVHDRPRR
jgi:uncharacterized protein YbjT (DUF2867 family)